MSIRIIPCETCCGEGRIWKSRYGGNDPDVWDAGPCPECDGACVIEAQVEPRTLEDLDDEDLEMTQAQLERTR